MVHRLIKKTFSSEYGAWRNAIARCTNENHAQWDDYGGRGIAMDASFMGPQGFDNFLAAVGPKPDPALTLDRVSNERGYEPGNLAWTTRTVQQRNRRRPRAKVRDLGWGLGSYTITRADGFPMTVESPLVPLGREIKTVRQWAVELGVSVRTLTQRLKRGKTPAEALTSTIFHPNGKPRSTPTIH